MKQYTRKASAVWQGGHRRGGGVITRPSAVLQREAYTFDRDVARRGTSPPELVAAAHAGSFSLTLANELDVAGYRPRQIDTTATVTMEDIAAGWTMTQIHLDVVATVPKVAQCDFVDAALRAKANCPISRSLNANISMRATLSQRGAAAQLLRRRNASTAGLGILRRKGPKPDGAKS
jgi:lipoyl-dependent peroxiredoxin